MIKQLTTSTDRFNLVVVVFIASFFLIFLGMRIAYIKGDFNKAKQRPKATVQEAIQYKKALVPYASTKDLIDVPIVIKGVEIVCGSCEDDVISSVNHPMTADMSCYPPSRGSPCRAV